ncbi:MAG: hypothetical protein Q9163_005558 [Psora crenata]
MDTLAKEDSDRDEVIRKRKRRACDQISAWKTRGHLPQAIESTWLLMEAILADTPSPNDSNISVFSIKAGYITAISRFVTALLDSSQTSKFKVSMYTKAGEVGLPAMFVELRHEGTHGDMPELVVLRDAARKGVDWLWEDYWRDLEGGAEPEDKDDDDDEEGVARGGPKADGHGLEAAVIGDGPEGIKAEDTVLVPWGAAKGWTPRPIGVP